MMRVEDIEALTEHFRQRDEGVEEAIDAMLMVLANLAIESGSEVDLIGWVVDAIQDARENRERLETGGAVQ